MTKDIIKGLTALTLAMVICQPVQAQSMNDMAGKLGGVGTVLEVASVLRACSSASRLAQRSKDLIRISQNLPDDIAQYHLRNKKTLPHLASASKQNRNCFVALTRAVGVDWEKVIDLYGISPLRPPAPGACDCREPN